MTDSSTDRATSPDRPPKEKHGRRSVSKLRGGDSRVTAARFALPAILLLFLVFFSAVETETFARSTTATTLLKTEAVLAILAIALLFPLTVGEFDLSVAANLGLGAILVTGLPSKSGLPLEIAIPLALLACTLVGLFNGFLVARVRINALIATLGTGTIVTGAVLWYTQGNVIYENIPSALPDLASKDVAGIPMPAIYLLVVALAAWYVLEHVPFGRRLNAIGGSREAARLSGVRVERVTIAAFTAAGLLCGVAGVLAAAQLGTGNPTVGPSFLLPAYAAAFLGATTLSVGKFNVPGTVLAVFTLAVGITGLQLMGVEFFVAPIFQGVALILAVTAARYLNREPAT